MSSRRTRSGRVGGIARGNPGPQVAATATAPPPSTGQQPASPPATNSPPPAPSGRPERPKLDDNPFRSVGEFNHALEAYKLEIQKLLPPDVDVEWFLRMCASAYLKDSRIRKCTGLSVFQSVAVAAQMGLTCNGVSGEGWLAPFKLNNAESETWLCTFLPGYQGLLKLAMNHPKVVAIDGDAIHAHDAFQWSKGTDPFLEHNWEMGKIRGDTVGAWMGVWLAGAPKPVFLVMDKPEIDACRDTDRDKDSLMWREFYDEGAKKTVLRRLLKWVPKSRTLQMALAIEDRFQKGETPGEFVQVPGFHVVDEAQASRTDELVSTLESRKS